MANYDNKTGGEPVEKKGTTLDTELAIIAKTFVSEPIPLGDGRSMILHAAGLHAREIEALNPVLAGDVSEWRTFIEPGSFIEYLNRFKQAGAVVFAYPEHSDGPSFHAHLNYHDKALPRDTVGSDIPLGPIVTQDRHRAVLLTPWDVDYAQWRPYLHGSAAIKQIDFALFIENMAHTILTPDAAHLQELVLDLQMLKNVAFKQSTNLRDGTSKFVYEETADDARGKVGDIVLPNEVTLRVPIYQGGEHVDITAKLRYQLDHGALYFRIVSPGIRRMEREEFRNIGDDIKAATDLLVLYSQE